MGIVGFAESETAIVFSEDFCSFEELAEPVGSVILESVPFVFVVSSFEPVSGLIGTPELSERSFSPVSLLLSGTLGVSGVSGTLGKSGIGTRF